jgi:hypothetical protein
VKASKNLIQALLITAEIYGKEFSEGAALVFANDLAPYPESYILEALVRCRRELSRFPSISEIILRVPDGRPGPEQAWAMLPKRETDSVVWTDEMREAFGDVRTLMEEDRIAARKAFLEVYTKLTQDARSTGKPARWSASLGSDPSHRETALKEAVDRRRLTQEDANKLLPDKTKPTIQLLQLEHRGTGTLSSIDAAKAAATIRQRILRAKSAEERGTHGKGKEEHKDKESNEEEAHD